MLHFLLEIVIEIVGEIVLHLARVVLRPVGRALGRVLAPVVHLLSAVPGERGLRRLGLLCLMAGALVWLGAGWRAGTGGSGTTDGGHLRQALAASAIFGPPLLFCWALSEWRCERRRRAPRLPSSRSRGRGRYSELARPT